MHANSEQGVAAHWRYKEGGRSDQAYERKINQLRSLLSPAVSYRNASADGSRSLIAPMARLTLSAWRLNRWPIFSGMAERQAAASPISCLAAQDGTIIAPSSSAVCSPRFAA